MINSSQNILLIQGTFFWALMTDRRRIRRFLRARKTSSTYLFNSYIFICVCVCVCMCVCVCVTHVLMLFSSSLSIPTHSVLSSLLRLLHLFTQLNDLRRQQAVIFIVATNRLRSFDAAVTRPGRFDILLFVGTPNLLSREKRLESRLEGTRMLPAKRFLSYVYCSFILFFICSFHPIQFHSSP